MHGSADRLCETLGQHGWNILRDSNVLRSGGLISGFMKRIGLADHVIVVLSDKYLRSPYCMLAYVNDTLHPHGFDEIVKDDFAALRQMLQRRPSQSLIMRSSKRLPARCDL